MASKSADSLKNMCRTCMSTFSNNTKSNSTMNKQCIYDVPNGSDIPLIKLLQLVKPQIKFEIKDDLPKMMCSVCIKKLLETHAFLAMYQDVDQKFRKMLKEIHTTNYRRFHDNRFYAPKRLGSPGTPTKDCQPSISREGTAATTTTTNYSKLFDESLEFIEEEDIVEDNLDDEVDEIKFELEVEKILEEECETVNGWPEFEEEPIHEVSDEDEEKNELFDNPYSDASDNEAEQNDASRNQSPRKISQKKAEASFENTIEPSSSKNENCNSKRKAAKNLETHMPPQNENGSVSCQECDTVLETIALWQEHMRQHRLRKLPKRKYVKKSIKPKKYYSCEYCAKEFSRDAAYRNHLRTHAGEEPYLCIECGKSFNVVSSLNTHMLRHKGEKNIQCPHCPKKFVCSSGLYGHMMVHTKEKRFVCTICGSAFHMAYQLRKHNLYHNNIRNYQCEYCDMRFVTGEKQRRHMRTHTGEKPYRCKYCERAFAQSNDCIKHLRQHLGDNVYQCELCPLRFPLARDLRVHFAGHKDDDEETRTRNLEARAEEERNLQIKLGVQDV